MLGACNVIQMVALDWFLFTVKIQSGEMLELSDRFPLNRLSFFNMKSQSFNLPKNPVKK